MAEGAVATARRGAVAAYDVLAEREVMAPMRDGVRLATDLYLPATGGARAPGRFPAILERTPYDKLRTDLVLSAKYFAGHGYAVQGRRSRQAPWPARRDASRHAHPPGQCQQHGGRHENAQLPAKPAEAQHREPAGIGGIGMGQVAPGEQRA